MFYGVGKWGWGQRIVEGNVRFAGSKVESGIRGQSRREGSKAFSRKMRGQQKVNKRQSQRAGQRSVVLGDSSGVGGDRRAAGGSRRRWMETGALSLLSHRPLVRPWPRVQDWLGGARGLSPHRAGAGRLCPPGPVPVYVRSVGRSVGGSGRRRPASAAAAASAGPGM